MTSGGIGSPRLLLLSGIGPADHLRAGRHAGRSTTCPASARTSRTTSTSTPWRNAPATTPTTTTSSCTAPCGQASNTSCSGAARSPRPCSRPAASGTLTGRPPRPDTQFHLGLGSGIEAGVEKLKNPGLTLNSAFLQPRSRGTVRLQSADPADAPLIDPNYWADPYDRRMALQGLRMAREILQQPALRPFLMGVRSPAPDLTTDEQLAEYAFRTCKTDHHPSGACSMGTGRDGRGRPRPAGARSRGPAGVRFLDHAAGAVLEHQRAHDHDRREGQRPRPGQPRHRARRWSMPHDPPHRPDPLSSRPGPAEIAAIDADFRRLHARLGRLPRLSRRSRRQFRGPGSRLPSWLCPRLRRSGGEDALPRRSRAQAAGCQTGRGGHRWCRRPSGGRFRRVFELRTCLEQDGSPALPRKFEPEIGDPALRFVPYSRAGLCVSSSRLAAIAATLSVFVVRLRPEMRPTVP